MQDEKRIILAKLPQLQPGVAFNIFLKYLLRNESDQQTSLLLLKDQLFYSQIHSHLRMKLRHRRRLRFRCRHGAAYSNIPQKIILVFEKNYV